MLYVVFDYLLDDMSDNKCEISPVLIIILFHRKFRGKRVGWSSQRVHHTETYLLDLKLQSKTKIKRGK